MNPFDKLIGAVHHAMPSLTDDQRVKLERIQNRATAYEAVLTQRTTGQQFLLVYTRKTRPGILNYVGRNAVELVAFCQSETYTEPNKAAGEVLAIGEWGLKFSGRTQREAILAGELPFWKTKLGAQS